VKRRDLEFERRAIIVREGRQNHHDLHSRPQPRWPGRPQPARRGSHPQDVAREIAGLYLWLITNLVWTAVSAAATAQPIHLFVDEGWHLLQYAGTAAELGAMARRFLLPTWKQWIAAIKESGCPIVCMHCDGYVAELLPLWIEAGFNCCYPVEVTAGNDIVALRRQHSRQMAYIGGVDKRTLAAGGDTLRTEVLRVVPSLLAEGGFIPACDHADQNP